MNLKIKIYQLGGKKKKGEILIRKCRKLTEKTEYIKDITLAGKP